MTIRSFLIVLAHLPFASASSDTLSESDVGALLVALGLGTGAYVLVETTLRTAPHMLPMAVLVHVATLIGTHYLSPSHAAIASSGVAFAIPFVRRAVLQLMGEIHHVAAGRHGGIVLPPSLVTLFERASPFLFIPSTLALPFFPYDAGRKIASIVFHLLIFAHQILSHTGGVTEEWVVSHNTKVATALLLSRVRTFASTAVKDTTGAWWLMNVQVDMEDAATRLLASALIIVPVVAAIVFLRVLHFGPRITLMLFAVVQLPTLVAHVFMPSGVSKSLLHVLAMMQAFDQGAKGIFVNLSKSIERTDRSEHALKLGLPDVDPLERVLSKILSPPLSRLVGVAFHSTTIVASALHLLVKDDVVVEVCTVILLVVFGTHATLGASELRAASSWMYRYVPIFAQLVLHHVL